jgi:DNA-binding HxlR family transcriptional regulator
MSPRTASTKHVEKISEQLRALSTGAIEKFKLIDFLKKYGETSFADLELGLVPIRKSTLYNYLADLVEVGILEKRVEKESGKRPSSFYSLGKGIDIHLTPETISAMIDGKSKISTHSKSIERLMEPPEIKVIDELDRETGFHPSVLMTDLLNAGIKLKDGLEVADYVMENVYDGIPVDKIKTLATEALERKDKRLAEMYTWYIDAPLTVELNSGKITKWDRERLIRELEKRWVGVEKSRTDLEVMAVKIERNLKKMQKGVLKSKFILDYMDTLLGT